MYHSHLIVNTGVNPDRPRPGRNWLNNIYAVHQRLCMGFPSDKQVVDDPDFLSPFDPNNFSKRKIVNNSLNNGNKSSDFLFRIENNIKENSQNAVICIQSEDKPDWYYAFRNAHYLLEDVPIQEPWEFNSDFSEGDELLFRIKINLSKKSNKYNSKGEKDPQIKKNKAKELL